MVILIVLFLFIALTAAIMIYAYHVAFYVPKRTGDEPLYRMPEGTQYEKYHPAIEKSILRMVDRPFEPVTATSFDGLKLYAKYYHVADGAPLQIQFHGYRSSAYVDFSGGSYLAGQLGHNAIVVDQRSHGRSEGSIISFGINERRDCLTWIEYARQRFGEDTPIILAGLSMGAATVLMAADLELPDNVVGIMADCPYSAPKNIILKVSKDMHFPPRLIYPFVRLSAALLAHFNLEESNAIDAVRSSKIPILLIHGEADDFVPCEMSKRIYEAAPAGSVLELVPGAGHGLCYMVDPERYEEATRNFVDKILS